MDMMEAIRTRRSVRQYADTPIPEGVMRRMRQALRFAPSACNNQPWHFVLVGDAQLRREVAHACKEQTFVGEAPVVVVACGFRDQAGKIGGHGDTTEIDVAIALDHLTLAAVEAGLGTCWIGAFDEAAVKALVGVPDDAMVVALTPLGYPTSPELNHPLDETQRKDESEIFSLNRYGASLG